MVLFGLSFGASWFPLPRHNQSYPNKAQHSAYLPDSKLIRNLLHNIPSTIVLGLIAEKQFTFDNVVDVDVEKCVCFSVVFLPLKGASGRKVRELSRVGGICLVGFSIFQTGL